MKQFKTLLFALALLAPQNTHTGWLSNAIEWANKKQNKVWCALGLATIGCTVGGYRFYKWYTKPMRSENELNLLEARRQLVVQNMDELIKSIQDFGSNYQQGKAPSIEQYREINTSMKKTNETIQEKLREEIDYVYEFISRKTATTEQQEKEFAAKAEILTKLDDQFNTMTTGFIIEPLEQLSTIEIKPKVKTGKGIGFGANDESKTKEDIIHELQTMKQNFEKEMDKFKSPNYPPEPPKPKELSKAEGKHEEDE